MAAKVIPTELVDAVLKEGLGEDVAPDERSFWHTIYQRNYTGDAGRKRVRISSINLRDRDGLHSRLDSVRCPVLRMHGTEDPAGNQQRREDGRRRRRGVLAEDGTSGLAHVPRP